MWAALEGVGIHCDVSPSGEAREALQGPVKDRLVSGPATEGRHRGDVWGWAMSLCWLLEQPGGPEAGYWMS